ncbi:MAG: HesA/MoeB/ThiF family protein [Thermoplasmata archaeon]|nr:HesA/MoeB/ThiF family protein [Thermoplasmata archaeon]
MQPVDRAAPNPLLPVDPEFIRRYGRQIILPEVGLAGQRMLQKSRVLIVGLGGLGTPVAVYLAAAGVGELHLVDPDVVEESNLHRQILYEVADIGRPKAEVAAKHLLARVPRLTVRADVAEFDVGSALHRVEAVDLVVDASDNFPTRYLVNDACARVGRPDVFAAVHRLEGQVATFHAASGPCYRCLFPDPPPPEVSPACGEAGVLGVVTGLLGTMQAAQAIRFLLGWRPEAEGRLTLVDAQHAEFTEVRFRRRDDCLACGNGAEKPPRPWPIPSAPPTSPVAAEFAYIAPAALADELRSVNPPTMVDVRSEAERAIAGLPGATWVPLELLAERLPELSAAVRPVVYCQWGGRSELAGRLLVEAGLRPVRVLRGGLDAYAAEVDPTIPRI